jgi:hypothetical protein
MTTPEPRVVWAPKASAYPEGHFMVAYNAETQNPVLSRSVRARFFRADGNIGPEFQVGNNKLRWQNPDVQVLPNQATLMTWQSLGASANGQQWSTWAQPVAQSGAAILPAFLVGADKTFSRRACHLTPRSGGGCVFSWESGNQDGDGWGAYARLLAPLGASSGSLSITRLTAPEAGVVVGFSGEPLECYELQGSEDILTWISIFKTNSVSGKFQYHTAVPPGLDHRFFRVERIFSP